MAQQPSYIEQAADLLSATKFNTPIDEQPKLFLKSVWSSLPDQGILGLIADDRYLDRKSGEWHDTAVPDWVYPAQLNEYDLSWAAQQNSRADLIQKGTGSLFWLGASRKTRVLSGKYNAHGSTADLMSVGSFWADLDCAKENTPLAKAFDACLSMALPPTFIIFSGGGLQVVHVFYQPWAVLDREQSQEFKAYSLSFYNKYLYPRLSMSPDTKVHDAARMMRLPGFVNRKPYRQGAVAQILYYEPSNVYTPDQLRQSAPVIRRERPDLPQQKVSEDGTYAVTWKFVDYMVNHAPVPPGEERHGEMISIASVAARAGMPQDMIIPRLRTIAEVWYRGDRPGHLEELDRTVAWAYDNLEPDNSLYSWVVRPTETGFDRIIDVAVEKSHKDRTVTLDGLPPQLETHSLPELRRQLREYFEAYLNTKIRHIGSYALIQADPGVGKTREALLQAIAYVEDNKRKRDADEPVHGPVVFASQFKRTTADGRLWLLSLGIDPEDYPPNMFGFLEARSSDSNSPGYCADATRAEAYGAKRYNVRQVVCRRCPLQQICEQQHYLSQFERLKSAEILFVQHHHLRMSDVIEGRKLVIIDESPLDIISDPITVGINDIGLRFLDPLVAEQYAEETELILAFLDRLRTIVANNKQLRGGYAEDENVKRDGYWLINGLEKSIGADRLARLFALDKQMINLFAGVQPFDVGDIPPNFFTSLLEVLRYEYINYYKAGAACWNSRLVVFSNSLRIYTMQPFKFTQNTKVVILDATGLPELYDIAFADMQGRPRQQALFIGRLTPPADTSVIQYTGTRMTKSTVKRYAGSINRIDLNPKFGDIETVFDGIKDTYEYSKTLRDAGNAALAQLIVLVHELSLQHDKKLLTIVYKAMIGDEDDESQTFFRKWLKASDALPEQNVKWFGSVRGKNDWKDLPAELVVGTYLMQEQELLIQAQIWHWQSDGGIVDAERTETTIPYLGYVDPSDGKGRGYRLETYKDSRVHALFLNTIQSELRQCADRIRLYSSSGDRTLYLASEIPSTLHVTHLVYWDSAMIDFTARREFAAAYERAKQIGGLIEVDFVEVAQQVAEKTSCIYRTARDYVQRIYETESYKGQPWRDLLPGQKATSKKPRAKTEHFIAALNGKSKAAYRSPDNYRYFREDVEAKYPDYEVVMADIKRFIDAP